MSDAKPSKRERATNKIINLTGLGKSSGSSSSAKGGNGNQAGGFPSFRFSPDSEEIQEVLTSSLSTGALRTATTENDIVAGNNCEAQRPGQSESVPSSPRSAAAGGPGETSPLKEYIRKSWANKFDKKALSLDLDQRGRKIITAIEDKRKSIVSHFIPEEGLVMPTVSSIREHRGEVVLNGTEPETNRVFSFDSNTQQVSSNIQQSENSSSAASTIEDYEEIGVDYLANMDDPSVFDPLNGDSYLEYLDSINFFTSTKDSDSLREPELGLPPDREPTEIVSDGNNAGKEPTGPPISSIFTNMIDALIAHPWSKYFAALLGIGLFLPLNSFFVQVFWFIGGFIFSAIVLQSLTESPELSLKNRKSLFDFFRNKGWSSQPEASVQENPGVDVVAPTILHRTVFGRNDNAAKGWMLALDGAYAPKTSFRVANPVFLDLQGSNLCISYPSARSRIPKRRYWNESPHTPEVKFTHYNVFNLTGAEIFIAPTGLAKNRVWNKKYPIGITFPKAFLISNVTPVEPMKSTGSDNSLNQEDTSPTKTVADEASDKDKGKTLLKGSKEVRREDWSGRTFYLYSRTSREKDDWFRRFVKAAKMHTTQETTGPSSDLHLYKLYMDYMGLILPNMAQGRGTGAQERRTETPSSKSSDKKTKGRSSPDSPGPSSSSRNSPDTDYTEIDRISTIPQNPESLNALLGRMFFDFLRSELWNSQITSLIQKKLNYLRKPPYMEYLIVRDLYLGNSIPIIHGASTPMIDGLGLWVDLDISYEGTFCVTLETKLNFMKLRRSPTVEEEPGPSSRVTPGANKVPENEEVVDVGSASSVSNVTSVESMYDSDADDSGESTDEESEFVEASEGPENPGAANVEPSPTGSSLSVHLNDGRGGKFMKMMEKVANSNLLSELKVVKKAMAGVANMPLLLTVEVQALSGTIALNIPPPPSNRLWFGFRSKPVLKLSAKPKVGDYNVGLTHVTNWIQEKIEHEASRILVLPNMDDISIPLMDFKLPS